MKIPPNGALLYPLIGWRDLTAGRAPCVHIGALPVHSTFWHRVLMQGKTLGGEHTTHHHVNSSPQGEPPEIEMGYEDTSTFSVDLINPNDHHSTLTAVFSRHGLS